MTNESQKATGPWYKRRANIPYLLAFGGISLYVLTEHWAHAAPYLPWLLILACPLMHIFMHRGHGGHGGHDPSEQASGPPEQKSGDER